MILKLLKTALFTVLQVCCKKCRNNYEWDDSFPRSTNKCPTCGTQNQLPMSKFGFSFSWKRALGITAAKQRISRKMDVPTTKQGIERKVGASLLSILLKGLFGKK